LSPLEDEPEPEEPDPEEPESEEPEDEPDFEESAPEELLDELSPPRTFFFLPVLKSVSYQPSPFKRNLAAETSFVRFDSPQAGQSFSGDWTARRPARDPGRFLEQQTEEAAFCQPQQEQRG
jgi:hypothetical protein